MGAATEAGKEAGLLERERELGSVESALDGVAGGSGRLVLISGPAGIGKTRLLRAAQQHIERSAISLLRARGGDLEREFPFGIMRQLFEPTLRGASGDERRDLLSGPAALAGDLLLGSGSAEAEPAALDHALYWLVANLGERGPLALSVDDLHWADGPSLRAFVHLARRLDELPVAVLVTMRPSEPGARQDLLDRISAEEGAETLALEPLSPTGAAKLVRVRLEDSDEQFVRACHTATGGNPFLLTELTNAVDAAGLPPVASSADRVRTIGPEAVGRSVVLRLESLSPAARALAEALAVLGEQAPLRWASRLAGLEQAEAATALEELAAVQIVVAGDPVGFVHAIVRTAIHDALPAGERSARHLAAAELLEELDAGLDAIAAQLLLTEPDGNRRTVERLRAAAAHAAASAAPDTVAAYLSRALLEPPPPEEKGQILLMLGGIDIHRRAPEAVANLSAALAAAEDPHTRAGAAHVLSGALFFERRDDDALLTLERTGAELEDDHPELALGLTMALMGTLFTDMPGHSDRIERLLAMDPAAMPTAAAGRLLLSRQAFALAVTNAGAERVAAAAETALDGDRLLEEDPFSVGFDMAIRAMMVADRLDQAATILSAAIEDARSAGRLRRAGFMLWQLSQAEFRRGRIKEAELAARETIELLDPSDFLFPPAVPALVDALVERGELDAADDALARFGYDEELPAGGLCFGAWLARGRLRLARGATQAGLEDVLEHGRILAGMERVSPAESPWRSVAAVAHAQLGEQDRARELAGEELRLAREFGAARAIGIALRAAGIVEQGQRGIDLLREAADEIESSPAKLEHARALTDLGAAIRRAGKREAAREPLRQAREVAERCGADALANRALDELKASGARPRRTALSGVEALTPSERRVVDLALKGMTNRAIAQALFVTTKTIEDHLRNSYGKLGIQSKGELGEALAPES